MPGNRLCEVLRVARADAYDTWYADAPLLVRVETSGAVVVPPDVAVCLCAAATFTAADLAALDWLCPDDFLDLTAVVAVEEVLAVLVSLPELRRVRLPLATADMHLGILRTLPSLRELVLRGTGVTDMGMEALRVLHDLRALDLAQTRVSTPGIIPLRHLTTLESLDISHTYVGDEALFYLRAFTHLRSLTLASYYRMRTTDLGMDGVTDIGLGYLRPLTQLETVRVRGQGGQGITDAGFAFLSALPRLRHLTLPASVTDATLARLTKLQKLESLSVQGCHGITDAGLSQIAGLSALTALDLGGTRVLDAGIPMLGWLANLRTLSLAGTAVRAAANRADG